MLVVLLFCKTPWRLIIEKVEYKSANPHSKVYFSNLRWGLKVSQSHGENSLGNIKHDTNRKEKEPFINYFSKTGMEQLQSVELNTSMLLRIQK